MIVNENYKKAKAWRTQERNLKKQGYDRCEPTYRIVRGAELDKVITDTIISTCGKYIYYKIG